MTALASWCVVLMLAGLIACILYVLYVGFDMVTEHSWTQRQEREPIVPVGDPLVDEYADVAYSREWDALLDAVGSRRDDDGCDMHWHNLGVHAPGFEGA